MYSFIKVCEYFENLISVQTLLLFNYTGSALKGDWKIAPPPPPPRTISPQKLAPNKFPPVLGLRFGLGLALEATFQGGAGNLSGGNFPSNALKNTHK